jgi:hypothetical protein
VKWWGLGVEAGDRFANGLHYGVGGGVSGEENAVLPAGHDLAVLGDHGAERATLALFDRLDGQSHGLFQEFSVTHGTTSGR